MATSIQQEKRLPNMQPRSILALKAVFIISNTLINAKAQTRTEIEPTKTQQCITGSKNKNYNIKKINKIEGIEDETMLMSSYFNTKNENIALVQENRSNSKSVTVIPLKCINGMLSFDRIIKVGIDHQLSYELQQQIYSGIDYQFESPAIVTEDLWENIDKLEAIKIHGTRAALGVPIRLPNGDYTTPVEVRGDSAHKDQKKQYIGFKGAYIDFAESACYSGCPSSPDNRYIGFVGPHKIRGALDMEAGQISGQYRYKRSKSDLYLKGSLKGTSFSFIECEDADCKKQSGVFRGNIVENRLEGIWSSTQKPGHHLNFVLVPDSFP